MIQTLIDKIPENLSKSFLNTGLLPALVLLFFVLTYAYDWEYIVARVDALGQDKWISEAFIDFVIVIAMSMSLVFLKDFFILFLETLPGRIMAPIRDMLIRRSIRLRQDAINEQRLYEYNATAVDWCCTTDKDRWFIQPRYPPPVAIEVNLDGAIEASRLASVEVTKLSSGNADPAMDKCELVISLLTRFYIGGLRHYADRRYETEILNWKAVLQRRKSMRRILSYCIDHLYRKMEYSYRKKDEFPQDAYVRPTRFGNCLASINDYAKQRYGIYTLVVWQRLWFILSAEEKTEISAARLKMETCVNLLFVFTVSIATIAVMCSWKWLDLTFDVLSSNDIQAAAGGLTIDWRSFLYLGSLIFLIYITHVQLLIGVRGFKEKITSLVDVKRLPLVKSMGFTIASVSDENELFGKLQLFFEQQNRLPGDWSITLPEA